MMKLILTNPEGFTQTLNEINAYSNCWENLIQKVSTDTAKPKVFYVSHKLLCYIKLQLTMALKI